MWGDLSKPWQEAFNMAWEAYKRNTIPIGCVIVNKDGEIVSKGRNRIYDKESSNPLSGINMAHAEMTALFGLKDGNHPNVRTYELYTTMEPCPMCFGTIVMMNIRNIRYGARDGFAGATSLNDELDYIKNKKIDIKMGSSEIEAFHLILHSAYEYKRQHSRLEEIFDTWREINKYSIEYGKKMYEENYFDNAIDEDKVINEII